MTAEPYELVTKWELEGSTPTQELSFNEVYEQIEFFSDRHYRQFTPTVGPEHPDFFNRLKYWLDNVRDEKDKNDEYSEDLNSEILFKEFYKIHIHLNLAN